MPAGKDVKGRVAPPVPESPLWLPSLAQPKTGTGQLSSGNSTLPKKRDLPLAGTLKKDPAELYKLSSLTQQPLNLPALGSHGKVRLTDYLTSTHIQAQLA